MSILESSDSSGRTHVWYPKRFGTIRLSLLLAIAFLAFLAVATFIPGLLAHDSAYELNIPDALQPPSLAHWFGTDEAGRDLYSRVIFGTRYSLGIAVAVVVVGAMFGTLFGAFAGLASARVDSAMMRIVDIFLAFPALVLAMAVAAVAGRGLASVFVALVIVWWPAYARVVRSKVLSLRKRGWVDAANVIGAPSNLYLVRRHILPFVFAEVNVLATTDFGYALVVVSALSFVGLGAQPPTPEWGLLVAQSHPHAVGAWWYAAFPGMAIVLTTLAIALVGDHLIRSKGR